MRGLTWRVITSASRLPYTNSALQSYVSGEALHVGLLKVPQRLPDLLPVVQAQVLDEVGLAHVRAERDEQVYEGLQRDSIFYTLFFRHASLVSR